MNTFRDQNKYFAINEKLHHVKYSTNKLHKFNVHLMQTESFTTESPIIAFEHR